MRRWIAPLVVLALIPMGAIAETKWKIPASETVPPLEEIEPEAEGAEGAELGTEGELAEVDPVTGEVSYPFWMDETDGSEMLFFMVIDSMNDETTLVEKHGAITIRMDYFDEDGSLYATVYDILTDTEFGKMIYVNMEGYDMEVYSFSDRTIMLSADGATVEPAQASSEEEFEAIWSNQYYPLAGGETLHAMAPDADGNLYLRTSSEETGERMEYEYMLGPEMRLLRSKIYLMGEDGELELWMVITYSVGEPLELPDSVIEVLRESA
ncbi:MAG: hypothetical protein GX592_09575 [Clostridiales bacterium]|nr:hypothetical protein [Clostridiales bacterium]